MLDDLQISELVQRFYDFELDEPNRVAAVAYYDRFLLDLRGALARNELSKADRLVGAMLQREGISSDLDTSSRAKLGQAVLRVSCDVAAAMKARFEGEFNYVPKDELLVGSGTTAAATPPVRRTRSDLNAPTFTARSEEFREERQRRAVWDGQTALQARKTFQLFAELSGDKALANYTRADAVRFKNLLCDLPANYGKSAAFRGMRADAIVEASKSSGEKRLSPRTIQRHLSALSCLWDEELETGRIEANIFKNFKLPASRRPQDQRAMWPSSKLKILFDTPIWRGCKSIDRRTTAGTSVIRDDRFWLPLIAIFSGMRQEEICQLELTDLRDEGGVLVFDIHGRGERNVKNLTAVRLVPVHSQLIRLGLLDYAAEVRKFGYTRLFHRLARGGADQRFGHNYAKWFTRYRRDVGVYEPGLDFHSFRHSATTFMAQAGVSSEIIDRVTGHVTAGETARYTKMFRIEQIREAIESIDPGIDLSFLYLDQELNS